MFVILRYFQLHFWAGLFLYYMKLGVPGILEDYQCSHQTILEVLSQKELTVLQNNKMQVSKLTKCLT